MTDIRSRLVQLSGAAELIGLAVFAAVVFGALGVGAKRRAAALESQERALESATTELGAFRAAFRAGNPQDAVRTMLADSLAVSIPHDLRVTLAGRIATLAEGVQLTGVRVWFTAGTDSAVAPPRPDLARSPVSIANYTLSVDCTGAYDGVLALLRQLPPSVALERISAAAEPNGRPHYHLSLAVFEAEESGVPPSGAAQHG